MNIEPEKIPRKLKKKCKRSAVNNILLLHGLKVSSKDLRIINVNRKDKDFLLDIKQTAILKKI